MEKKSLADLDYDLELEKVVKEIKKQKAKRVLIQLPEGLKPAATLIVDELKKQTKGKVELIIWLDSCFGACDVPVEVERLGVDLIVQFGHSNWDFSDKKGIKVL
jgi:2-(3-amino-3-carboxypropyl)histidine synthase